jgi:hypothetical protein
MLKAASLVSWFCAGVAVLLVVFGVWNILIGKHGEPVLILLFCLLIGVTFYCAGRWVLWMARRS